ncbi:MAG: hypothetical protein KDE09_20555 [Anaerolineales bacterium]|nr:hypothetical protein [Anaerolineales bacterium]
MLRFCSGFFVIIASLKSTGIIIPFRVICVKKIWKSGHGLTRIFLWFLPQISQIWGFYCSHDKGVARTNISEIREICGKKKRKTQLVLSEAAYVNPWQKKEV